MLSFRRYEPYRTTASRGDVLRGPFHLHDRVLPDHGAVPSRHLPRAGTREHRSSPVPAVGPDHRETATRFCADDRPGILCDSRAGFDGHHPRERRVGSGDDQRTRQLVLHLEFDPDNRRRRRGAKVTGNRECSGPVLWRRFWHPVAGFPRDRGRLHDAAIPTFDR